MRHSHARPCVLLLVFALYFLPPHLQAQSPEDDVVAAVQELFDAMATGDTARAGAILLPEGQLVVQRPRPDGSMGVGITPHRDFIASLAQANEPWIERMWDSEVRIEGSLASLWTPYDFHSGTTFSHCGVEVFTLLQTADGWKITGGTYTVEQDCQPSPLGPVG